LTRTAVLRILPAGGGSVLFTDHTAVLGLRAFLSIVEPDAWPKACRDASDDVILATASAAQADSIVTGDPDLLVLRVWRGIRVLRPRHFLEELDRRM
jgi:predicted nucleic acid-binding protein